MKSGNINMLVLCTGNSARSIMGEVLINHLGKGKVCGFSAGSTPTGKVNPHALDLLRSKGLSVDGLRSKSWDAFSGTNAPGIDIVVTVCSNAAGEACPVWPGHPLTAHWGIPDPAAVEGTKDEIIGAFSLAYDRLEKRITKFISLPIHGVDDATVKSELDAIGKMEV